GVGVGRPFPPRSPRGPGGNVAADPRLRPRPARRPRTRRGDGGPHRARRRASRDARHRLSSIRKLARHLRRRGRGPNEPSGRGTGPKTYGASRRRCVMPSLGLFFVGPVLLINGLSLLGRVDAKAAAPVNAFTGVLLIGVTLYIDLPAA